LNINTKAGLCLKKKQEHDYGNNQGMIVPKKGQEPDYGNNQGMA
jgi:hypothetical protein